MEYMDVNWVTADLILTQPLPQAKASGNQSGPPRLPLQSW